MPLHVVNLDENRFRAAAQKALALGTTPDEYVSRLIDSDLLAEQSFDQLLHPVREGFKSMTDEQIDKLFDDARQRANE